MITTADAPAWLRRSDQAVTWARTMLTPRRAVVIDCETRDLPGALPGTSVIRTCGIARERDCSADGKPYDSGTLSLEQDRQAEKGHPGRCRIPASNGQTPRLTGARGSRPRRPRGRPRRRGRVASDGL